MESGGSKLAPTSSFGATSAILCEVDQRSREVCPVMFDSLPGGRRNRPVDAVGHKIVRIGCADQKDGELGQSIRVKLVGLRPRRSGVHGSH